MSRLQNIVLAAVVVLLAAGLVAAGLVVVLTGDDTPVLIGDDTPRPVPIDFVSVGGSMARDPNRITAHWGCYEGGSGEATLVSEDSEAVTLSLVASGERCLIAPILIVSVRLQEPLGDRQVINQFDGSPIEVRRP